MKHQILGAGLLLAMCAAPAAQAQISLVNPVPQEVKSAGKQLMSLPGKWTLKADAARLNAVKAQRPLDAAISQTLKGLPTSAAAQHVCTITFGVKGDKAVKKYAKQVPAKAEAYV